MRTIHAIGFVVFVGVCVTGGLKARGDLNSFLKQHCVACHGPTNGEGGLRLNKLATELSDSTTVATWVRVHDRVAKGEMPPSDSEQPTAATRREFLASLRTKLHDESLARQMRDGRVVVRRLNRNEYQFTLHDLLGVTTELKSLLPEDSVVAGFDNVSVGLETSATHLVRYQQAAERALAAVLPPEVVAYEPIRRRWTGREFLASRPKPNREGTEPFVRFEGDTIVLCATLYKHGSVHTGAVPKDGRYRVRASVQALRNDGRPISVLIGRISTDRFGHEKLEHVLDVQDAPANMRRVVEVETNLPRGEQIYLEGLGLPFFQKLKEERKGMPVGDDYTGPGLAIDWIEWEGPLDTGVAYRRMYGGAQRIPDRFYADHLAGKEITTDWTKWNPGELSKPHNRLRIISPDPQADAERWLRDFLPRAFRRPVSEELLGLYLRDAKARLSQGEPLEEALPQIYKAILCSPHFLMLVERPGPLDDFALASRLSYFLWSSAPDDELLAAAARGELRQALDLQFPVSPGLQSQTERMLKHPKAKRFVESFTGQWLDLRKIHDMKPDAMYVEYDDWLAWSMPEETRRFFLEVLEEDLPISSFLHSNWTMLNERLAKHYGIGDVVGFDFRKVSLPSDAHRGGVVTHASVLKLTTNATYTSPIKRGAWILERILGTPPSPPPPNVAAIEPDIRGAVTIREQLTKHKSIASCAACHRQIDPPGFALENFDVVGGWRDMYRSKQGGNGHQYAELTNYPGKKVWLAKPVDSAGELASGDAFRNFDDYKALLLRDPDQLTRNLAEKLLTYATGSPPQFADRELVEQIVARLRDKNHGLRSLVHEVVQSRAFRIK